jgi:hypothetical protein
MARGMNVIYGASSFMGVEAVDVWRHGCEMTKDRPRLAGRGAVSAKNPRDSALAWRPKIGRCELSYLANSTCSLGETDTSKMDAFVTRKRKRIEEQGRSVSTQVFKLPQDNAAQDEEESTDFKLALLASLHSSLDESTLLESLLASEGSVEQASEWLTQHNTLSPQKRSGPTTVGFQSSLSAYRIIPHEGGPAKRQLVKKGQTLHLYSPEDIEAHTPCSIIHNFLPAKQAEALLLQLLDEAHTYQSLEFKLFEKVVWSPHTFCFYVNSLAEAEEQKTEYIYDGRQVEVSLVT